MGATLSVLGLYQYDNSIFDLMAFPDGFTADQKKIVIDNILAECAEFEFLYPAPAVAKGIIGIWSKKEVVYWNRVYKAAQAEYDPIENYRRNETEEIDDDRNESHSGSDTARAGGTTSVSRTGNETSTGTNGYTDTESGTDTTTNKIAGYDSNTLVDHDSSAVAYGHKNTHTGNDSTTITHNTVDTNQLNTNNSVEYGQNIKHDGKTKRKLLAYGNIGTMTSQDMLTQEMEVAKIINVIPIIIQSFQNRFCLMVY